MSDPSAWSQTDASNTDPSPDGWPEGMARSGVNDSGRAVMGGVRRQMEDPEWVDLLLEDGGWTVARVDDTHFSVEFPTTPTDGSSKFPTGCRVRLSDLGSGPVEGFVVGTVFATPITTVEVNLDGSGVVPTPTTRAETHITKGSVTKTAFSTVGTTLAQNPPQIPSIDLLGDGATVDQGTGNGFDADTVDGQHASDIIDSVAAASNPLLVNGGFGYWQRGQTIDQSSEVPNDNNTYTSDQWVLLQGSGTTHPTAGLGVVDLSIEETLVPEGVAPFACKMEANASISVTSEKFGVVQWVENSRCRHFVNQTVSASVWIRSAGSGSLNLAQLAIVQWTGTADTVSTDPINDWGAGGVEPTVLGSYLISSTVGAGGLVPSTSYVELKLENIPVNASMTNIGVMVYSDDESVSSGDSLYVAAVTLSDGATARQFSVPNPASELIRCERYFETTFPTDEEPRQNSLLLLDAINITGHNATQSYTDYRFNAEKFKTPTTVTYNPSAANNDWAGGATGTVTMNGNLGNKKGMQISAADSVTVVFTLRIHASAEAVLGP